MSLNHVPDSTNEIKYNSAKTVAFPQPASNPTSARVGGTSSIALNGHCAFFFHSCPLTLQSRAVSEELTHFIML